MRLTISIAHAAHVPERRQTFERLLSQLDFDGTIYVADQPGKPHEWSLDQWTGALRGDPTHCVMLNDDVTLCEDFVDVLECALGEMSTHLVCLRDTHELAAIAREKGFRWTTTTDGLVGQGYAMPSQALRSFLEWRAQALAPGAVEMLSEDQLLNIWAMHMGMLVWHPCPSLIGHDTSVPSLFGNQGLRTPHVPPEPSMPRDWRTNAVHAGRIFTGNHWPLVNGVVTTPDYRKRIERYYAALGDKAA